MKERQGIGAEVLTKYLYKSPSALPIDSNPTIKTRLYQRIENIYFRRLKLHPRLFKDQTFLDLGCGTGENDTVFASWGASGLGIDFNPESIKRANTLRHLFGYTSTLEFRCENVLDFSTDSRFDFVISDGVIPHVERPQDLIHCMQNHTNDGGFCVLGYLDILGNIQRLLHCKIVKQLAQTHSFDSIREKSMLLFGEHLERSKRFGGREIDNIINDYINNDHSYGLDTVKIIRDFEANGFTLYTSHPTQGRLLCSAPADPIEESLWDPAYVVFQQLAWMFGINYDDWKLAAVDLDSIKEELQDMVESMQIEKLDDIEERVHEVTKKIRKDISGHFEINIEEPFKQLSDLLRQLSADNLDEKTITQYTRLFKGYNGYTTAYLCFHKS